MRRALFASLLTFTSLGCSSNFVSTTTSNLSVSGNWQLASATAAAVKLPALSGTLTSSGNTITGVLHSDSTVACLLPSAAFPVSGTLDARNNVTLTGALAGGTFSLNGTFAADGKSLTSAAYTVTGGTCAFTAPADATAMNYASITGNYTGTFSDAGGQVLSITAALTQTPASDTSGNFQMSGTGTLGSNPCFSSPASVTTSQVTGGSFNLTYTDPSGNNSAATSGTFSTDGKTLTVTQWVLSGTCGSDQGSGILTKQ